MVISVQLKIHLPSTKKWGHTVHNGLMPISKYMCHWVALCAPYDSMGVENTVICSSLWIPLTLTSNPLITVLLKVDQRGLTCAQIQAVDDDWTSALVLKFLKEIRFRSNFEKCAIAEESDGQMSFELTKIVAGNVFSMTAVDKDVTENQSKS
ncbi:hypothetical protein G6F66_009036 [Rhizopus arrhizus]|nr:hypothetical protein G6F24_012307 [Rhizopus arrhizus]KAG1289984.1 hypothetical protein G6F66_009036 [Rhizopus arrhizus]